MSSKKSTNVRFSILVTLARTAVRALDRVSPRLASRVVFRAFATPIGTRTRPRTEQRALADAQRLSIDFGEHTLAAWRWGEGPTALLVHGWGGRGTQLHAMIAPLVAAGWSVVTFDAPAHGESTGATTTLPAMAAAIARVASAVGPVEAVVAHSLGGAATGLAIAQGLAIPRAVLVAPPADPRPYFERVARLLGADPVRARAYLEDRIGRSLADFAVESLGTGVDADVLVIHDRGDRDVPFAEGERVAAAIPNATMVPTEGLGHRRILVDSGVIDRVRAFVGERPRTSTMLAEIEAELWNRDRRRAA
jgi:pimeloyl-ACP methyl ester carboxylesterase